MRLFIAIGFSEENKDKLESAQDLLREYDDHANFTARENLHLTLVFLGEMPGSATGTVGQAMESVAAQPFELALTGLGRFRRGGDVWWLGVERNPALTALRSGLVAALRDYGVSFDNRSFSPHLTLAREAVIPDGAADLLLERKYPKIVQPVEKFGLYKSERIRSRLTYTEIYTVLL